MTNSTDVGGLTILLMRMLIAAFFLLLLPSLSAQEKLATVPAMIDHNRIVIEADVLLPNRTWQSVRAWVDNGNPDLYMSRHLATALGLNVTCGEHECSAPAPSEIAVGGMPIPLTDVKVVKIPLRPVTAAAILALGMNAEINIPSTILRHYDVLVDFPERKFSIGVPGSIHFLGTSDKVKVNPENGLIQVPSQIGRKKYNLGLDLGACISFLSDDLFTALASAHTDWPHMTGAVGSANMWGADEESKWNVMRVDRVQYGPLFLTDVPFVSMPKLIMDFFEKRAGMVTAGLIGSEALLNYRVGLDYTHSRVYFDIGRMFKFPDFDVVGLVLRPEGNGRYLVLGIPEFEEKPAVEGVQAGDHLEAVDGIPIRGVTMGQIWAMLGGTPGQEKKLTIERAGKEFTVAAKVQHFLGEMPEESGNRKK